MEDLMYENVIKSPSDEKLEDSVKQIRPWVRYFARYLDICLFAVTGSIILVFTFPQALDINSSAMGIIILFLYIFVDAFFLCTWGTTPGKWLLNTKVRSVDNRKLTLPQALSRSFAVWLKGLGLGLGIISMITSIVAYCKLKDQGITSWDRDGGYVVIHGKIGWIRIIFIILSFTAFIALAVFGLVSGS